MNVRMLVAALAVALVATGLVVWQPWTGQLEGTVYFTSCGGTEPANPPPGYKNCSTTVAAGAEVTASPAAGGSPAKALADSSGHYSLRLVPGRYYLWAETTRPIHFTGERRLVPVSARTTVHVDVNLALYGV